MGAATPSQRLAASTMTMDRLYRHQRHIYDLSRKFFLLGRDRLIERLGPNPGDLVLEIGCGTGRNLVCAALRYPHVRFFGIDVSTKMLASANEAIARNGLSSRITLAHASATALESEKLFGVPGFQRIYISYCLSMVPEWRTVLQLAGHLLERGGSLLIVDFGDLHGLPALFRIVLRRWLERFAVTPCDDLELELTSLADRMGATLAFERPYRGFAQYGVFERADRAC